MTTEPQALTALELAISAALERQIAETLKSLQEATEQKDVTFWTRQLNAARKAAYYWTTGVRPGQLPNGSWLVPSASRGGIVHQVGRDNGCSCEAGSKGNGATCWHAMLVLGMEQGHSDDEQFNIEPERDPVEAGNQALSDLASKYEPPAEVLEMVARIDFGKPSDLGKRIAERRRHYATLYA